MRPEAIPWAVCAAVAVGAAVHPLTRPWRRLGPRVHRYSPPARAGGTRAQMLALVAPPPASGAAARVLGPIVASLVRRLTALAGHRDEADVALALDRAGMSDVTPKAYAYQQLAYAAVGLGTGVAVGVLAGPQLGVVTAAAGLGWGVLAKRSELERRTRQRCERIRAELLSVCHVLAVHARATPNLQQVVGQVVGRGRGEVVGELACVLSAIEGGTTPEDAFGAAAHLTPEPAAARLYRSLATAITSGGDIADALLAQASDIREAQRDGRRAAAARRRTIMILSTVMFLLPPVMIFLAAPIPHLMFGR